MDWNFLKRGKLRVGFNGDYISVNILYLRRVIVRFICFLFVLEMEGMWRLGMSKLFFSKVFI